MYRVKTFQELTDEGAANTNNINNNNTFQDLDTLDKKNSVAGSLITIHQIDEKPRNVSLSRTETKRKSTMRPNSANKKPSQNVLDVMEIQDLDNIFAKFIDEKLRQKNQTKPMERIQEEFLGIMKDEDFDKKEFDFSKKMLRLKRKYPLPRYNDQPYPSEPLNRIKEHTEIIGQAMNINIESGVSNYLQKQREAQKEMEKEQIAQNIYHSTIILQNKIEEDLIPKSPSPGKNKLQTILLKKNEFHLKKTKKEIEFRQPTADRLESFTKFDIIENAENKKKQQEKLAQHQKTMFLNLVDSYERELEVIDKQMVNASKTSVNREMPSSSERSYLNVTRGKSFVKADKLKFVKHNLDLANSTNLLSLRVQAAKQKNVGFADLVNFKIKGSSNDIKMKEKKKDRSPLSKTKSRYQVSFDYAKVVESTML